MINLSETTKYTKNLSILFVEDHDELRYHTADILKNFFNTVDICNDGKKALEKYIEYKKENSKYYDIVLSDIQMPIMDGIELTEKIYEINPYQSIIILSAHDDSRYLLRLINLGIEQFIQKPIDYQDLVKAFLNISKKITNNTNIGNNSSTIELAKDFIYDINSKSLGFENEYIYLTKFEIIFMELLSSSIGKIYSNEDIVIHFSSLNENIDSANIRKLVSKLRKKLPPNCLESIYGIGYKLVPYIRG